MLLDRGADVNVQEGYRATLLAASREGYKEVVQILLDRGADVNAQEGYYETALQEASREGHKEVVQILLDRGADVNAQEGYGETALQAASREGHTEVVQILLDRAANVNKWNTDITSVPGMQRETARREKKRHKIGLEALPIPFRRIIHHSSLVATRSLLK